MTWPTAKALTESAPLPDGYRYELLNRSEIPALVRAVDEWFPGLAVGNASCYLREDFYTDRVFVDGRADRDFFVLLFSVTMTGQACRAGCPRNWRTKRLTLW